MRIDRRGKELINSQEACERLAINEKRARDIKEEKRVFRPAAAPKE